MLHESGGSFLAFGRRLRIKAWTTTSSSSGGPEPSPLKLLDANFSSHCSELSFLRDMAASRDLSKVATCYIRDDDDAMLVNMWK